MSASVCLCLYHLSQWLLVLPSQGQDSVLCCIILLHCEYVKLTPFIHWLTGAYHLAIVNSITKEHGVQMDWLHFFSIHVGLRILRNVHVVFRRVMLTYLPTESMEGLFSSSSSVASCCHRCCLNISHSSPARWFSWERQSLLTWAQALESTLWKEINDSF